MRNSAVVYLLVTAALLLILTSGPNFNSRLTRARKLHVSFDPLIDDLERRAMEAGAPLDIEAFLQKLEEEEPGMLARNFGEDGVLNTTERLTYLFPLLDQWPKDGFISFTELELWNRKQSKDRLAYNTERRMRIHDENGDGEVTLSEFLSQLREEERGEEFFFHLPGRKGDWDDKERSKASWWKDLFVKADADGNGSLNETEFNDFLHPEDSFNPKVQMWFQKEKLREMDQDEDEKLSFEEFREHTYAVFSHIAEFETIKNVDPMKSRAEQTFEDLDVDGDKFLSAAELKPIIPELHPGEYSRATYYTKHLMYKADDNKDGKLSLEEMLNNHYDFYNAVVEESHIYDDGDDYEYYGTHDEI